MQMRVATGVPVTHARPASRPVATPTESEPGWLDTFKNSALFTAGGLLYKFANLKSSLSQKLCGGLEGEPASTLKRPVMLVPGFTTEITTFEPLMEHLTRDGANGGKPYYLRDGQVYLDPECSQKAEPDPAARVFRVVPHGKWDAPPDMAAQLHQDLPAIREFTGASKVDAAAYSMGGISTRLFLDQQGDGVGKLMMIGTPNRGTRTASLCHWAVTQGVGWAMSLAGMEPAALPALAWLRSLDEGENPQLASLNDRLEHQMQRLEDVRTVGSDGFTTPAYAEWGFAEGDSLVEAASLKLKEVCTSILPGGGTKCHQGLPDDPEVYGEMRDFFGWG